ncbi:expressed unknown protein [Seminavis robusta]|uniref:CEL-III C-terminal domain-containing protein n=1 Tax=Seminavis robusta TaxID=568900 RepID=A0A9N8F392_9STRA|nr:expressed unknown protein [Seminavis robusta]|eukprot:Sro3026_g342330.1 n/a (186) ;mRNA; r:1040-1597
MTLERGTAKTKAETKTDVWSTAIATSVEGGIAVEGFGGVKASIAKEQSESFSFARLYATEFSSETLERFSITFSAECEGKALWQWTFGTVDPYANQLTTFTSDYAITETRGDPPRCQPGFSQGTTVDYQKCSSDDRLLPGFETGGYGTSAASITGGDGTSGASSSVASLAAFMFTSAAAAVQSLH